MIGTSISHYEVVEEIGRGGMGIVYKAEDNRLGRVVALKFLAEHLGRDEKARERFMQEARAAAALSHANIATLFDVGDVDGRLYLAMEYVEGRPLDDLIRENGIPPTRAIEIAIQTAEGLHRAHETGIVHRDIKPANIRISELGEVKILDFGLAKLSDSLFQSATGTVVGTAAYMSPEQIRGEPLTRRTDLWSLGVVLYEMLTGRRPFIGEYEHAMYYTILNVEPMNVSDLRPELGTVLDAVVARLIAKKPEDRYASCMELVSDLEALLRSGLPARMESTRPTAPPAEPAGRTSAASAVSTGSEARRQLTVVHCEIAGFGDLATVLDPEDLFDLSEHLRTTWERTIQQFDGYPGTFSGGAMSACFGFPTAHEHDARRALRCALALQRSTSELAGARAGGWSGELTTRIGVHTGIAVAKSDHGELLLHGNVENVAARLTDHADVGTIVTSRSTRHICGGYFHYDDLGERPVRGFSESVPVYRVTRESRARTRLDFVEESDLSPLVGRDVELGMLRLHWRQALTGQGGAILLTGEAGIGKSRLVDALLREVEASSGRAASLYCSQFLTGSAFAPIIRYLRDALADESGTESAPTVDTVRSLLASAGVSSDRNVYLLCLLLGLEIPTTIPRPELAPAAVKQASMEMLLALMLGRTDDDAVLLAVEDLHWADPSTREWIATFVAQAPTRAVLLVLTTRPEFRPDWLGMPRTTKIELNRLTREDLVRITRHRTGKALPDEVIERILDRTDGVPLFVEELTSMILESGALVDEGDRMTLNAPLPDHVIPDTLQGSLAARLDRIPEQRYLMEIGSVLGRQFSFDLLHAVAGVPSDRLESDLAVLVDSELMYRRGFVPDASYIFKHALVQDAAYNSMLRSRRRTLHEQVALVLQERDEDVPAELIALHYAEADLFAEAIPFLRRAGRRAMSRYENAEAVQHLSRALDLVRRLPQNAARDGLEIDLLVPYGHALNMARGYWVQDGEKALLRAVDLSEQTGSIQPLTTALIGLGSIYQIRGEYEKAVEAAERSRSAVLGLGEDDYLLLSEDTLCSTCMFLGNLPAALEHIDYVLEHYDPQRHAAFRELGVGTFDLQVRSYRPLVRHLMGYASEALDDMDRLLSEAASFDYHFDVYHAYLYAGLLYHARREFERCTAVLDAYLEMGRKYGDPFPIAISTVIRNLASRGEDGLEPLRRARSLMNGLRSAGYGLGYSVLLGQYADGLLHFGELDEAETVLEEAVRHLASVPDELWAPEIHRLRAELSGRQGRPYEEVESHLRNSIESARAQQSYAFELRSAISLAEHMLGAGRTTGAAELLRRSVSGMPPGSDLPELVRARELMGLTIDS